jgi:hypothetical protein
MFIKIYQVTERLKNVESKNRFLVGEENSCGD